MGEGLRGDGLRKDEEDERCNPKAGPGTALPFLFISFVNHRLSDYIPIAE
jgi:hypothetical protein